jgi:hypothetical protein
MTGYKIIVTDYSGAVTGDDVIFTHKEAADYLYEQEKARAAKYANQETAPEIKFETVTYVTHSFNDGLIGRVIHRLNRCTRKDCVRETAFSKLTQEEINAIQDDK